MSQLARSAPIMVAVLAGSPASTGDWPQSAAAGRRVALDAPHDKPDAIRAFWDKVQRRAN